MSSIYNLKNLKTPVVKGYLLVVVTFLIEWIPGLYWLFGKDSGVYNLRHLDTEETPTYFPFDVETYLEYHNMGLQEQSKEEALEVLQQAKPKRIFSTSLDFYNAYKSNKISPVDVINNIIKEVQRDAKDPNGIHA
jgi:hypothetical protein